VRYLQCNRYDLGADGDMMQPCSFVVKRLAESMHANVTLHFTYDAGGIQKIHKVSNTPKSPFSPWNAMSKIFKPPCVCGR
jgi:hypothetical protein